MIGRQEAALKVETIQRVRKSIGGEKCHPPGRRELYDYAGFMEDAHARIASEEMSAVSATEAEWH